MKKILKIGVFVAIVIFVLYSCAKKFMFNSIIKTVKDGYFYEEISDVTIGKMMDTLCTDSKWEYTPDESGLSIVTYTGKMKGQPVKMMFSVYNVYGSMNFQLIGFSLNGQAARSGEEFSSDDELSVVPFALYKAYKSVKKTQ